MSLLIDGFGTSAFGMPLPVAPALALTPTQRTELRKIARYSGNPQVIMLRCQVVIGASEGRANDELTRQPSTSLPTVLLRRRRFMEHGLLGVRRRFLLFVRPATSPHALFAENVCCPDAYPQPDVPCQFGNIVAGVYSP